MKDKQIENLIKAEKTRQKKEINLIAAENFVSDDVLKALGSELTNKYAEGYSKARYYGGNKNIDKLEDITAERALKTFGISGKNWDVNTQALSGSPANLAVLLALTPKKGKIMGLSLTDGGHLTHGHKVSATGQLFKSIQYNVDPKTEQIDYKALKKLAKAKKPHVIIAGFTAYPRKVDWKKFREIADAARAYLLVDMSHVAGLIAGKAYPSPFKYADVVTTTVHKTLRGPRAALIFSKKDKRGINKLINKAIFPGLQGGPHANQIAASAVALKEAQSASFKKYTKQTIVNAKAMADEFKKLGWRIVSGGTDSHLFLIDTWEQEIGGKEAGEKLEKAGIIVNKNTIPGDKRSPMDPSGIRIGTPAQTTRGWKAKDFIKLARKIDKILQSK